jgi:hypothetical protein
MVEPTNPKTFISGKDKDVNALKSECAAILKRDIPDQIWTKAVAQYKKHMKDFEKLDPNKLAQEVNSVLNPKNK